MPDAARRTVIELARARSRAVVASLDLTGRFALRLRQRGGPGALVRVPCDGCGLRPALTTRAALLLGAAALCECCAPTPPAAANDADPAHDFITTCGCDLCVSTEDELCALADAPCAGVSP